MCTEPYLACREEALEEGVMERRRDQLCMAAATTGSRRHLNTASNSLMAPSVSWWGMENGEWEMGNGGEECRGTVVDVKNSPDHQSLG